MKLPAWLDKLLKCPLQLAAILGLALFCVLPTPIPFQLSQWVESSLGIVAILVVGIVSFLYAHPALTVMYVISVYVLMVKSGRAGYYFKGQLDYTPTERQREAKMKRMNPPRQTSLEEEMVNRLAPVGHAPDQTVYVETTFKPVKDDDHNAFNLRGGNHST